MKSTLILFCCFLVFSLLQGANFSDCYFTVIDSDFGLSQNNVNTIIQDSRGFMWFGTKNRLNRYDGTAVKVFDCYDSRLDFRNNNISALHEDEEQNLWVGTDKGVFIYNPIADSFTYFNDSTSTGVCIIDWIADIQSDNNGNIWIVVPKQGLFRYNFLCKELYHYALGGAEYPDKENPQSICVEAEGRVWVGTNGAGVFLYDKNKDTFTSYLGDKNGSSLKGENIYTLCDYGDELLIGIHEGKLRKLNKRKNTLTDIAVPEVHYRINRFVTVINDRIWAGTQAGIFIIDETKQTVEHIHENRHSSHALSDNMILRIYRDREGGIWVATGFGGVNYLPDRGLPFELYTPSEAPESISGKRIRTIKEDKNGTVWVATEEAGLNLFNPQTKKFRQFRKETTPALFDNRILGTFIDDNRIWVGFFKNGMDVMNLSDLSARHYTAEQLGLNEASIYTIYEDRNEGIWIGNAWGVFKGDKNLNKYIRKDVFGLSFVLDITEDWEGNIWVATMGNGVFKYNPLTEHTLHFLHDSKDTSSLSSNSVSNITKDSQGDLWFSTDRGGICKYNQANGSFSTYSIEHGLPDDVAYKILEDKHRNLWFGTNKGLVRFNPETESVKVFTKNDGLPGNQFNYNAALAARSGKFYFGTLEGLVVFDPYAFKENGFIPPVYITNLTIFNREVHPEDKDSPLKESIVHTNKIVLNHNQSNIAFDFAALSFTEPSANRYAYKMEGIDRDWIHTVQGQTASYAKLPPGNYTFRVKGCNNDGLWNETGAFIDIEIKHPWWNGWQAHVFYMLVTVGLIYYLIHWYRKRNANKIKLIRIEKEKELYGAKLEFFTEIAHEVKTPLTLINGPLEVLRDMKIENHEINRNLDIMGKNAFQLLNLINQLLDFRKIDVQRFVLNFTPSDIGEMLQETHSRFESVTDRESKRIVITRPSQPMVAWVDKEAFSKILNNLFSNAVNYSDRYIEVSLEADNECFTLLFQNDGELVPPELQEKIFEPFYRLKKATQYRSGTGIGLSLVRSLCALHGGSIHFHTRSGFNNFLLKFPLHREREERIEKPDDDYFFSEQKQKSPETVLIVEDNPEMLSFIASKLQEAFGTETAGSASDAVKMLEEKKIDLIVSDVMMPETDGFEFCRRLKADMEYSHIPIVLLTVKNDLSDKIYGLEVGAEAYMEKPFSPNHLLMQIATLLSNRKREREAFIQKPFILHQQIGMTKSDSKFLDKVVEIIHTNITDGEFNVENLAAEVFMSRSSLHRKIKALTDLTPAEFIRLIRLKKAAELIRQGEYRTSEVGYRVGINSPSHFIKLFQQQFGMTPKEFSMH